MRLPLIAPADLTPEQRPLYDDMRKGIASNFNAFKVEREDGALMGPWNPWLHEPAIGKAIWDLTLAMTANASLPDNVRQIAILVVGARFDAAYELYAHIAVAEREGMKPERLATLVADLKPVDLAPDESVAFDVSYALVRGAVTPAGLLYDLVQPELKTMYPLLAEKVVTFSPNDVVQLSNAATVALTVTAGAPDVALRVLEFAVPRLRAGVAPLCMYHYGRTGEPVNDTAPGINEWSTLVRLACQLSDRAAAGALLHEAVAAWDYYLDHTPAAEADAFVASEALASMSALLALVPE